MITANPDVDIAQFVTAFNQLVIHIVNILAIAASAQLDTLPIAITLGLLARWRTKRDRLCT